MEDSTADVGLLPPDTSATADEVSSGSDRSFEADDVPSSSLITSGSSSRNQPQSENLLSRRRRQGSHGSRRQKGGSRHKHKGHNPYPGKDDGEFPLKQKSLLQEKENAAAIFRYDESEQFVTIPIAPFNSTQFLIDEHCQRSSLDVHKSIGSATNSCSPQDIKIKSVPSTPVVECSNEAITFEKDREFTDFFATAYAERLQSLPKSELVRHYINLEDRIAALQKKVAENEQKQDSCSPFCQHSEKLLESNCNSDANSLSSYNEEFQDFSTVNQTPSALESTDAESLITNSNLSETIKLDLCNKNSCLSRSVGLEYSGASSDISRTAKTDLYGADSTLSGSTKVSEFAGTDSDLSESVKFDSSEAESVLDRKAKLDGLDTDSGYAKNIQLSTRDIDSSLSENMKSDSGDGLS